MNSRACLVMAQLLEDSSFCEEFIQQCPAAVEVLNLVAQECSPGEHAPVNHRRPRSCLCGEQMNDHVSMQCDPLQGSVWAWWRLSVSG